MKRNVFVFHENHNKKRFLECTNTKGIKVVVIGKNYLLKLLKLKITKNSPSFSHEKFTHVEKGVRWCSSIFNFCFYFLLPSPFSNTQPCPRTRTSRWSPHLRRQMWGTWFLSSFARAELEPGFVEGASSTRRPRSFQSRLSPEECPKRFGGGERRAQKGAYWSVKTRRESKLL